MTDAKVLFTPENVVGFKYASFRYKTETRRLTFTIESEIASLLSNDDIVRVHRDVFTLGDQDDRDVFRVVHIADHDDPLGRREITLHKF